MKLTLTHFCTVGFCRSSPPIASWFKLEVRVRASVGSDSCIITEWKFLRFQKTYQCRGGGSVSHTITVSVQESSTMDYSTIFWLRVLGFVLSAIGASCALMKCCSGSADETTDPNSAPSLHQALPPSHHIYENDPESDLL